jgi:hypothetical protein
LYGGTGGRRLIFNPHHMVKFVQHFQPDQDRRTTGTILSVKLLGDHITRCYKAGSCCLRAERHDVL